MYESKKIFFEILYCNESCHLSEYTLKWFGESFENLRIKKICARDWSNWLRDFGLYANNRHDHEIIWLFFGYPRLENGRVFNKFKPLNIWTKIIVLNFYSSESCHLSEFSLMSLVPKFSRLSNKLEVWVSCEALCYVCARFFCLSFLNEIQPVASFTEYWIYNH